MTAGRLVVLALIAGVLLTSGAFLDWSGVDYSSRLDRGLALLAGCVAIVSAALALLWRLRVLALAIASGALGLNMAIVNIKDISSHDFEYAKYPDATVGAGLYLVLGGAALALAVGLAALLPRRYLSREQPRQERTSGKWVSRPSTGPSRRVTLVSTTHSRTGDPRVDVRLKAIETRSTGRGASVLPSRVLARVGAGAALLGGIAWAVKGAVILTTGEQPPFVFALGPPLFAVGLIGLYARLGSERGRAASAGLLLACASILLAGVLLVAGPSRTRRYPPVKTISRRCRS